MYAKRLTRRSRETRSHALSSLRYIQIYDPTLLKRDALLFFLVCVDSVVVWEVKMYLVLGNLSRRAYKINAVVVNSAPSSMSSFVNSRKSHGIKHINGRGYRYIPSIPAGTGWHMDLALEGGAYWSAWERASKHRRYIECV